MRGLPVLVASVGCAVLLTACSSSSSGGGTGSDGSSSSSSSFSSSSSSSSTSSAGGVANTHLDPCKLVTRAEASKIAGANLAAGKESGTSGGAKICSYSGSTLHVFTVEVVQGTSASQANADWDAQQARAQEALKKQLPAGISVKIDTTSLKGVGDRAATARASAKIAGQQFSVSGIYVLKGATFFAFQDLSFGSAAASASALKAEAQTVLGRI